MHEGEALLETWARALEGIPLPTLVESFANTDHVETLRGGSGARYRLRVNGFWGDAERAWKDDFYLLLSVRPSRGWRRFVGWRAHLVAPYVRDRGEMKPLFWVQREARER